MLATTIVEKIMLSLPLLVGIAFCIYAMFRLGKSSSSYHPQKRVSDLEELYELSDDDYILVTDSSEKKSVKVKLCVLSDYIEKRRIKHRL